MASWVREAWRLPLKTFALIISLSLYSPLFYYSFFLPKLSIFHDSRIPVSHYSHSMVLGGLELMS